MAQQRVDRGAQGGRAGDVPGDVEPGGVGIRRRRRGRRTRCTADRDRDLRGQRREQPRGDGVVQRAGRHADVAEQVAELHDRLVDRRAVVAPGDHVEDDAAAGAGDGGGRLLQGRHGGAGGRGEQGAQVVAGGQLGQPGEELGRVVGGLAGADGDELRAQARAQLEDPAVGMADVHDTQLGTQRYPADIEDRDPVRQQRVDQVGQHRRADPARPPRLDVGDGGDPQADGVQPGTARDLDQGHRVERVDGGLVQGDPVHADTLDERTRLRRDEAGGGLRPTGGPARAPGRPCGHARPRAARRPGCGTAPPAGRAARTW